MKIFILILSAFSIANSLSNKKFPIPNDCSSYKVYNQDEIRKVSCLQGKHFSPEKLKCLPPKDAKCYEIFRCDSRDAPYYIPDPFNCKIYFHCINGKLVEKSCGTDLWFDAKDDVCLHKGRVICDNRTVINPSNSVYDENETSENLKNPKKECEEENTEVDKYTIAELCSVLEDMFYSDRCDEIEQKLKRKGNNWIMIYEN